MCCIPSGSIDDSLVAKLQFKLTTPLQNLRMLDLIALVFRNWELTIERRSPNNLQQEHNHQFHVDLSHNLAGVARTLPDCLLHEENTKPSCVDNEEW